MTNFKKYKDFIFLSVNLEIIFEINQINSILPKAILEINNNISHNQNNCIGIEGKKFSKDFYHCFRKRKDLSNNCLNQIQNNSNSRKNLILEQNILNKN